MPRANLAGVAVAVLCAAVNADSAGCVWYDECGKDPSDGRTLNCRYDGQPGQANAQLVEPFCSLNCDRTGNFNF